MNQSTLLSAREAAERLRVKVDTLYAYVSRGLLRSVPLPDSRERGYRREDIDAFRAARGGGRAASQVHAEARMPAIESAISLIEGGRLYYRGRDAIRLSDTATLEDVAALLWGEKVNLKGSASRSPLRRKTASEDVAGLGMIERCQVRLASMPRPLEPMSDRGRLARAGARIVRELIGCATQSPTPLLPAHRQLAACWRLDEVEADLLRRCLVLIADHELNTSTLAARCVASTGAPLQLAVSAALGALSGPRHGGAVARVEALFHAGKQSGDPVMAMAERLGRGEQLPGIGQPLYPEGDPRAVAILYALSLLAPHARRLVGYRPNVDFALAAATTALGLPQGAALGLFIVGRSVGWIAHAIEQYESGVLIRPRARYTGPRPAELPETKGHLHG